VYGRAVAPGAGTVVNALATGRGSAFALDVETTASVRLTPDSGVDGVIDGAPDGDTSLIERCVETVVERFGDDQGGRVRTASEVPTAAGLKSSSAAANATVLATLAALDVSVEAGGAPSPADACRIGVDAAREAGVTVTGAFDDASASMLGGVTVTDNTDDTLLDHASFDREAAVWTPPERAYSADTDTAACERVAPVAAHAVELALAGNVETAMTVNGLAFSAALDYSTAPAVEAMPHCGGVSLSGTGPSVVAVGGDLGRVADAWRDREGTVRQTTTRETGARILARGDGEPPNDWGL
jgi:shikimate kinase (EC 2.7.1.71)